MVLTVKRIVLCFGSDNGVRTSVASFFTEPLSSAFVSKKCLAFYFPKSFLSVTPCSGAIHHLFLCFFYSLFCMFVTDVLILLVGLS